MLKKIIALTLAAWMLVGCFTACGKTEPAPTTTTPAATEPAEEAGVLKVLTLGHSLAVDSCHMINMIAALEGIGEYEEIVIGTLYYSGCRLSQHVKFLQADSPEYNLYLSSTKTPDQPPKIMDAVTMMNALKFDYWDIIVMQAGGDEVTSDKDISGNIKIIQDYVNEHKFNPLAIFAWHMTWSRPADETIF